MVSLPELLLLSSINAKLDRVGCSVFTQVFSPKSEQDWDLSEKKKNVSVIGLEMEIKIVYIIINWQTNSVGKSSRIYVSNCLLDWASTELDEQLSETPERSEN